jgi:hypothetical protein
MEDTMTTTTDHIDREVPSPEDPPEVAGIIDRGWIAVGNWGSLEAAGATAAETVAEVLAGTRTGRHYVADANGDVRGPDGQVGHLDHVWLCPVDPDAGCDCSAETCDDGARHADDCPIAHDDDCDGSCWSYAGETPAGCGRTLIHLERLPLLPAALPGRRVGWIVPTWHDHTGPGGCLDTTTVAYTDWAGYSCSGWDCGATTGHCPVVGVIDDVDDDTHDCWADAHTAALERLGHLLPDVAL